jgi:hypothetical protein
LEVDAMPRRIVAAVSAAALSLTLLAGTALAGQPNQSCDDQPLAPAGFSSGGFANAEAVYANPDAQGGIASGNVHVVSQYDVACYQVSLHH